MSVESWRSDRADQGKRDGAAAVDAIDARQIVLSEHDNAHAVAAVEAIGPIRDGRDAADAEGRAAA
jgi:hypothetical protein